MDNIPHPPGTFDGVVELFFEEAGGLPKFYLLDARHLIAEADTLCQRQFFGPIDRIGLAAHVLFPGIRAGLTPTPGLFFAPKSPTDLCAGSADINVGDATIGTGYREELLDRAHAV